jgi:ATP-binding cassette, subfamily B, multidrug efflux pump
LKSLSYLNKYFYKYRFRLLIGVVFVAVSNVFGIMPAKLIRHMVDTTAQDIGLHQLTAGFKASEILVSTISFNLLVFVGLVLLMALLKGLFMFLMRQTIIIVSRYIEYDLKNEVFNHYQQLDYNFFARNNTGDLMNRISEDVGRVRMYVGPAIMYTVNLVVMFILVIYAMVQVSPQLTLYTLIPLPFLSILIYKVEDIINRKSEQVQRQLSDVSSLAQESFSGVRVLKAFAMEPYATDNFRKMSENYARHSLELVKVNALFQPSLLLLVGLSTVLTIYFGGMGVINGTLTIGNVAEFVIYVNMLTWPVASLGWVAGAAGCCLPGAHQ